MPTSLLVISDREPLAWMLRTSRFALPAGRAGSAPRPGDTLLLYTTRGCYRNPTRDRGLVMGVARVASAAAALDEPVSFRGRDFGVGLALEIDGVCPVHVGVDLAGVRGELGLLAGDGPWSYRLRRTVVPLSDADGTLLRKRLVPLLRPVNEVLAGYEAAARVVNGPTSGPNARV